MKPTVVSACVVLSLVALSGCDESTPTFPIGDGGWQVVLEIGRIPNPVDEYPVFIEIEAQVINLTDGRRPSDGAILLFETSAGTYENGLNEIEIGMPVRLEFRRISSDGEAGLIFYGHKAVPKLDA